MEQSRQLHLGFRTSKAIPAGKDCLCADDAHDKMEKDTQNHYGLQCLFLLRKERRERAALKTRKKNELGGMICILQHLVKNTCRQLRN